MRECVATEKVREVPPSWVSDLPDDPPLPFPFSVKILGRWLVAPLLRVGPWGNRPEGAWKPSRSMRGPAAAYCGGARESRWDAGRPLSCRWGRDKTPAITGGSLSGMSVWLAEPPASLSRRRSAPNPSFQMVWWVTRRLGPALLLGGFVAPLRYVSGRYGCCLCHLPLAGGARRGLSCQRQHAGSPSRGKAITRDLFLRAFRSCAAGTGRGTHT